MGLRIMMSMSHCLSLVSNNCFYPDSGRELPKAVEPHIKQEDEGKFRCRTCNKLFKASSFVEKHVANKHPELVGQLEEVSVADNQHSPS